MNLLDIIDKQLTRINATQIDPPAACGRYLFEGSWFIGTKSLKALLKRRLYKRIAMDYCQNVDSSQYALVTVYGVYNSIVKRMRRLDRNEARASSTSSRYEHCLCEHDLCKQKLVDGIVEAVSTYMSSRRNLRR